MLRALEPADAPALQAIDAASGLLPWSLRQFTEGLNDGEFGWGAELEGSLRAFALFSQILDEVTLLNIAVHPGWRRQGLAERLLRHGLAQLVMRGAERCLLEVRESNTAAIVLYQRLGFTIDGRRRDYYPIPNGREDALLMSWPISDQLLESM